MAASLEPNVWAIMSGYQLPHLGMTELLDRHRRVMGNDAPLFYDEPLELVKGEGVWLEDVGGRRYLDLYNNVPCVGHANPRVVAKLAEQAATLNVHSRYLHDGVVDYVERLVGLHHDGIESAILGCSGTEATEMALTLIRGATGKRGIICTDATYHGNSSLVSRLSWLPVGVERNGVKSISTPQLFRPLEAGLSETELLHRHLDELASTIASFNDEGGFAGLMLCSILANEGLPNPPASWFVEAVGLVRDAGGLVIADEVQAGFARSGSWWGYETNGFVPDVVCMGKPMGNGFPLSAMASSHDLIGGFRRRQRYFNTFASSPLQAAAGMAVIDEIADRGLVAQVAEVGNDLKASLADLQPDHPRMGDVRGTGLFIGVDWVHPDSNEPDTVGARQMVEVLKSRGMLLGKAGQHGNVLKIRPPLVFDRTNAADFLEVFIAAVADAHS
ncbi:MAG: aminotransferase class III-fold pyridoxal phosphate-dependent enzyme [Actinomycetota bacterium]|nr:aminotransferase class III-fold pyridoxal phosphate-dependent enzyme [Actinomycetota bacterium]